MTAMALSIHHVRPPRPLRFPASDPEWNLGQSTRHFKLCVFLWEMLRRAVGPGHTLGADNFVYFDGADERRKCAPDAFVKLGVPQSEYDAWKTWESGTPELCIEVLSPSDTQEPIPLSEKLSRFHSMGVREVVACDVDAPAGRRLRAWDRIDGDLVERIVEDDRTPCLTLGKWFHVLPVADLPVALALAETAEGDERLLTDGELAAVLERKIAAVEARAQAAERRIAELEAALRRGT